MIQALQVSQAVTRTRSSAIRDLLKITDRPEVISLAGGLPDPDLFPADELATALSHAAMSDRGALQYSPTEGYLPLRSWVAASHSAAGRPTDPDNVVITHGAQQALDLIFRSIVDPGDVIAMADPGYVGAIQAAHACGAELVGIRSDVDGLCVDDLATAIATGVRPNVVYVVPNFDNPSGATLSLERRQSLLHLADRHGFVIVEDDPYGALRWSGPVLPPVASLSNEVISVGTVSKILCPGLRVGWVAGPPLLTRALTLLKQATDLHTSSLAQRAVHQVLATDGFLDRHLARLVPAYATKAEALSAAVNEHLGDRATFRVPDGGMFLWVTLAGDVDTADLLEGAVEAGVAFVPGNAFGVDRTHLDTLRLSFATSSPAELDEGMRRLAAALAAS